MHAKMDVLLLFNKNPRVARRRHCGKWWQKISFKFKNLLKRGCMIRVKREGIRMLMANILPQCIAGSLGVHRSTVCCHRHRLCEMRKNNDRPTSERPSTDRSSQSVCKFIFGKKTNVNFIKAIKKSLPQNWGLDSPWCPSFWEMTLSSYRIVCPTSQPLHAQSTCNWRNF